MMNYINGERTYDARLKGQWDPSQRYLDNGEERKKNNMLTIRMPFRHASSTYFIRVLAHFWHKS